MLNTKKQFQKVIGEIRKEANGSYPKAMMTQAQMGKREATVNCGGEWTTAEKSKKRADTVMNDERFRGFLMSTGATAKMELDRFGSYQIRIRF